MKRIILGSFVIGASLTALADTPPLRAINAQLYNGAGTTAITATGSSINANITNTIPVTGTFFQAVQPVSQSGNWTVLQGTSPWVVSGTVAATQSGTWTFGRTWTLASGTDSVTTIQGTSPWVISGTVTANAGTNLNTSALALDTSVVALQVAQGSTTSGQKGGLILGAVTTAAPSYTTGQSSPISLTPSAAVRTDSSATVQPVSQSGTWTTGRTWTASSGTDSITAVQGTTPWVNNISQFGGSVVVTGTGASGVGIPRVTVANDSKPILWDGINTTTVKASSTAPTTTDPALVVALSPNGAQATAAIQNTQVTQLTSIFTGQTDGTQKTRVVDASGNVQPTGDVAARKIFTATTDGTNTQAVKAASTSAVSTDPSAVVSISSNFPVLTGTTGTAVSIGIASTAAVASNANRAGLILVNTSNAIESCTIGTSVLRSGVTLYPGGSWTMDQYTFTTSAITCIASAAASNLSIQEFTK